LYLVVVGDRNRLKGLNLVDYDDDDDDLVLVFTTQKTNIDTGTLISFFRHSVLKPGLRGAKPAIRRLNYV
jgi:hypothetical protein